MLYSSATHTRFYHGFHVVRVIKYCYKVLQGPMRERIWEIIVQTCAEIGVHIVQGVLGRDHVPEVMSQPPLKMSLTVSSRSIWNYIPLNHATGVSR